MEYSAYCSSSSNLFGCVGLRKKQYCIFNKQYSPEEFAALREKIIAQMNTMPYRDKAGRVYKYGEFFPIELSPHAYNNTIATDHFPLTKEAAAAQGYPWMEPNAKEYEISMPQEKIPDSIRDVQDSVLKETLQCGTCKKAYKIIKQELAFLRQEGIPLPRLCLDCRFAERLMHRNKSKLYTRSCACAGARSDNNTYTNTATHAHGTAKCATQFESAYSPDRSEIVYCEACYQQEVA